MSEEPPKKRGRGRPKIIKKRGQKSLKEMGVEGRPLKQSYFQWTCNTNKPISKLEREGKLKADIENLKQITRDLFSDYRVLKGSGKFEQDDFMGAEAKYIVEFQPDASVELISNYGEARLHLHGLVYIHHRSNVKLDKDYITKVYKERTGYNCFVSMTGSSSMNNDQLLYHLKYSNKDLLCWPENHVKKRKKKEKEK